MFFLLMVVILGGVLRPAAQWVRKKREARTKLHLAVQRITPQETCAMVPAHNEELSIAATLKALKKIIPAQNIYVGSDASTDRTAELARELGVNVADINPNRGKAGVLVFLLRNFKLSERYRAIMIVDADAEVSPFYLQYALPLFDDPKVVAVAGHGSTKWPEERGVSWAKFFLAYRVRLWRLVQYGMRYGQTWKYSNTTYIVPGSPSIYRASALSKLEIDAPNLVIEDFNMTFELHKKRLGKIAYDTRVSGVHQDPYTLNDYIKQIRRWYLGFWQTVRRNGFWPSFFWLATGSFVIEMALYSAFILCLPLLILWFFMDGFEPVTLPSWFIITWVDSLTFMDILVGVFIMDYILTAIAAVLERRPELLFYGLGFFVIRYIDAFMYLYTLPLAFAVKSTGAWTSPRRRATQVTIGP